MTTPEIITLGCRLNAFESEVMRRCAGDAGLTNAVIINTCAVTAEAERQARQTIRRARKTNPGARIIVTGCAAQISAERFAAMPEVDHVLGNVEKLNPKSYVLDDRERVRVSDVMAETDAKVTRLDGLEGRTRAFVQVQQGCDHRCTFCIIPYARGNSRSIDPNAVIGQIRALVDRGYREVVLTGVDISSYGRDLPDGPSLGTLARRILDDVKDLARLRLSSLDPAVMDAEIFALLADAPRFMPHLHLSLQAGNDMILKRMKRRHDRARAVAFCDAARRARPDVVLGADIIAGFPTETEAMFADSVSAVAESGLTYLHVFPYSPRPGTPAARIPAIPAAEVKERARRLRAAGDAARSAYFDRLLGETVEVLVERNGRGYTPHYAPAHLTPDAGTIPGEIIAVRVSGHDGHTLAAEMAG